MSVLSTQEATVTRKIRQYPRTIMHGLAVVGAALAAAAIGRI